MKSKILFAALIAAIAVSVYFTYERSFVTRDFVLENSEEEVEETEEEAPSDASSTEEPEL